MKLLPSIVQIPSDAGEKIHAGILLPDSSRGFRVLQGMTVVILLTMIKFNRCCCSTANYLSGNMRGAESFCYLKFFKGGVRANEGFRQLKFCRYLLRPASRFECTDRVSRRLAMPATNSSTQTLTTPGEATVAAESLMETLVAMSNEKL